jgi:hypothetical protein
MEFKALVFYITAAIFPNAERKEQRAEEPVKRRFPVFADPLSFLRSACYNPRAISFAIREGSSLF